MFGLGDIGRMVAESQTAEPSLDRRFEVLETKKDLIFS